MAGFMAVFWKELADHFSSKRFIILFLLVYLAGIGTIYIAAQAIRIGVTDTTQFIFLRLFIVSSENIHFSFLVFLSFFIPVVGIALGFDAISSERNSGNLSRILSQPVYRDSVINAKFLAGLATISLLIVSIVFVVGGLGLRMIGVPPNAEELLRLFAFMFVSILYGGFWLALAILFSVFFKRTATSILASIAIWLCLILFIPLVAQPIANGFVPVDSNSSLELITQNDAIHSAISRISPSTLYGESVRLLLLPEYGNPSETLLVISIVTSGMIPGGTLSLGQSLLVIWPQIVSLIALASLCFALSYIKFMREEIRST